MLAYPVIYPWDLSKQAEQDREHERELLSRYGREELDKVDLLAREERWEQVCPCCIRLLLGQLQERQKSLALSVACSLLLRLLPCSAM